MYGKRSSGVVWGAAVTVLMFGCTVAQEGSSEIVPSLPRTTMMRIDGCATTACESNRQSCTSRCSNCMDACFDAAFQGISLDCSRSCEFSCSGSECPTCENDQSACLKRSFRFEVAEIPDEALAEVCNRAADRDRKCDESLVDHRCDHFARVEDPEAAPSYGCISNLSCGSTAEGCLPPSGGLGTAVCGVLGDDCAMPCDQDYESTLDDAAGWLRQEVIDHALACMSEATCADKQACFNAWVEAVYPPS